MLAPIHCTKWKNEKSPPVNMKGIHETSHIKLTIKFNVVTLYESAPGFTRQGQTRVEILAKVKHSSLICQSMTDTG
jgi:hypothetical protein